MLLLYKIIHPAHCKTNGVSLSVGAAPRGECDREAAGSFWVFKSRVFWTEFIQTIIQYVKNVIDTSDLYVIPKKKILNKSYVKLFIWSCHSHCNSVG